VLDLSAARIAALVFLFERLVIVSRIPSAASHSLA